MKLDFENRTTFCESATATLEKANFLDYLIVDETRRPTFSSALTKFHNKNRDKIFVTRQVDAGYICVRIQ